MERGDITALVPPGWEMASPDPSWNGQRYVSPEGDAWIALYSAAAKVSLSEHMKAVAFVEGEEISYMHGERDRLVVAAAKGDRLVFRKAVLSCGEHTWRHIALEYPAAAERAFSRLIERLAFALDVRARAECETVGRN
jgi:hypothetical protein